MGVLAMAGMLLMGAASPEIYVGDVKADTLPRLQRSGGPLPTPMMVDKVQAMIGRDGCEIKGQTRRRFDIDVPYAVLVAPDGTASRVVVSELGCPTLENYVGLIVLEMGRRGDLRPTGESKARWFGSQLNFTVE